MEIGNNKFDIIIHQKNKMNGINTFWLKLKSDYITHNIYVCTNPFGNCQTFSIAFFNRLVKMCDDISGIMDVISYIKGLCDIESPLLTIDIKTDLFYEIRDHIKKYIYTENFYKNFTGTNMTQLLIITNN